MIVIQFTKIDFVFSSSFHDIVNISAFDLKKNANTMTMMQFNCK